MLIQYAITAVVIAVLALGWLAVQLGWHRVFQSASGDPDALAGRIDCHGCASAGSCDGEDCPDAGKERS